MKQVTAAATSTKLIWSSRSRRNAMKNVVLLTNLAAGLVLVCGTAQAQSPKPVCSNSKMPGGRPRRSRRRRAR